MNRRALLQAAGLLGLSVVAPRATREARADGPYAGPFWVFLNAPGGWDPTYLCDPKGGAPGDRASCNQLYGPDQIGAAGNLRYAPIAETFSDGTPLYGADAFFQAHHGRLCVVNGMEAGSVSHDSGPRFTWSGNIEEGYPALGALIAARAARSRQLPLAFQSNGGYDATFEVVPITRLPGGELRGIAYPNRVDPTKADALFHSPSTAQNIAALQNQRLEKMRAAQSLPFTRRQMGSLLLARTGDDALPRLAALLDAEKPVSLWELAGVDPMKVHGDHGNLQILLEQIQLAVLAFQAGVTVSANLDAPVGAAAGFDTHFEHDGRHVSGLVEILFAVDYLIQAAAGAGVLDRLYLVIGSDFGRTPFYNASNGKDHWDVTSMMFMGPGIPGDRVIGSTDAGFKAISVSPKTLEPDPGGVSLTAQHVHRALRRLAGLQADDLERAYPIDAEDLPIFG